MAAEEDLQAPGGALVLASAAGDLEWFEKTYEPYGTNASDGEYYLGLNRSTLANATTDLLEALVAELTWAEVARGAADPRQRQGRRVGHRLPRRPHLRGSRGAAQCRHDRRLGARDSGARLGRVRGCARRHDRDPGLLQRRTNRFNSTAAAADGIVGGDIPTAIFTVPMVDNGTSTNRYWSVMVVAVPDMEGNREQDFWYRYRQVSCAGAQMRPPPHGVPEYWDSYWYSRFPGANASDTLRQTLRTGPVAPAPAAGFPKRCSTTGSGGRASWLRGIARSRCRRPPPPTACGCSRRRRTR